MRQLLVLLKLCMLLLNGYAGMDYSCIGAWYGLEGTYEEPGYFGIRLMLFVETTGACREQEFLWENTNPEQPPLTLDGGIWREGTWSVQGDTLLLYFADGEVVNGTITEDGLLLDYRGGFLLKR